MSNGHTARVDIDFWPFKKKSGNNANTESNFTPLFLNDCKSLVDNTFVLCRS